LRKILLISLLAYSLLLIGLIAHNGEILILVIPFVIILTMVFLFAPVKPNLTITRKLSEIFISPGKPVEVSITIENISSDLALILIEDEPPPGLQILEGHTSVLTSISSGVKKNIDYSVIGKRGFYPFEKIHVQVMDPLSIFKRDLIFDVPAQFLIKPEVWRLKSILLRPNRTHLYSGPIPSKRGGAGINFFDVREYSFGDPMRRINWKKNARHTESLYSNHFEIERVTEIGLLLDARQQSDIAFYNKKAKRNQKGYFSLFEYSIHATAAMADLFLREGHRVGLMIYGRGQEATFPGYGKRQREKILRALAKARTGDNGIGEFKLSTNQILPFTLTNCAYQSDKSYGSSSFNPVISPRV
jgi:uncharacterized protein (DUF58 family)